ncbi:uncharacterized protein LOC136071909 [Hydra vulgaris]|uniref:Uncharacterized protein LOC136071909 n=1 Tax=Hydra vulgaris TaxID=6087 RepID=A0ABM4BX30_HYDVU
MKSIIFIFASLLLVNTALADGLVKIPKVCEDVLPADTCNKLRGIATKFHEQVDIVNQAVVDAFNHHITKTAEVLAYVKEYLVDNAKDFVCKEVLPEDSCKKIGDFVTAAHLQVSEVSRAVREAIVNGAQNATDLFNNAISYLTTLVSCENVFDVKTCDILDRAVKSFHENKNMIKDAIALAIKNNLKQTKEILQYVKDYLVSKATDFTCNSVITQDFCDKIFSIGKNLKLTTNAIQQAVLDAVVNGAVKAQDIFHQTLGFLLNDVKNLTCKDLVDSNICIKVDEYAKKLHMSVKDTTQAIKEAIIEGASNAKDLYDKSVEFLKAQFSCVRVFQQTFCDKVQKLADKFTVPLVQVNNFIRNAVANGISNAIDLYKLIVKFILERWNNNNGDNLYKRSIDQDEVTAKIIEAVEMYMDATNSF